MTYDQHPDRVFPHWFGFDTFERFDDALDWCFDAFGDDENNNRWTYTHSFNIRIKGAADALQFWIRWGGKPE